MDFYFGHQTGYDFYGSRKNNNGVLVKVIDSYTTPLQLKDSYIIVDREYLTEERDFRKGRLPDWVYHPK